MNEIGPKLNFVVGPNGAGKSSVFRAIRTLIEGARAVGLSAPFEDGRLLCSRGSPTEAFEVALGVEFDTDWEQELIATYLCAAMTHPDDVRNTFSSLENAVSASDEGMALYANWLQEVLRPEAMPFLFHGELRFYFRHFVRDDLQLTYTFEIQGTPITIRMASRFSHYGVFLAGYPPTSLSGNNPHVAQVMLRDWKDSNAYSEIHEMIQGKRLDSQVLPGSFDVAQFVLRLAGANAVIDVKTIPRSRSPYIEPHKRLTELAGRPFDEQQSTITFGELMYVLLSHSIVMTSNFRFPPEQEYTYTPQASVPTSSGIYDDRQLAQRLFDLKNGVSAARATYGAIQSAFSHIAGDELTFDLVTLSSDEGIALQIQVMENDAEIPIAFHGAGIWEALVLAALLMDNTGKVTLLDEPAANLHPQMQRRFIGAVEHIQENIGSGQTIIVTHSQHLLPTQKKDLRMIRRIQRFDSSSVAFGLGSGSKVPLDILEQEMSGGSDLAGLLFADGVMLVEGATETAAIGIWFPLLATSRGRTLADINVALFAVNGAQSLPFHIQYLVEFGVPWAVICDADVLDLRTRNDLWRKLVELGALGSIPTQNEFAALKLNAASCGIFTANTELNEKGFEEIPGVKAYVDAHEPELPDKRSKPRRGRYIARHLSCPDGVARTIEAAYSWLRTSALEEARRYASSLEPRV
jgi:hypothetical protein